MSPSDITFVLPSSVFVALSSHGTNFFYYKLQKWRNTFIRCHGRKHGRDYMPLVRNAAFLSLSPAWEKNPFPSIIEDAYTPRNTDKGANKCCPVDTIVLIRILNTAQWNIGLGPSLNPGSWYHKQLYPKTDLINVFGLTSKLSLFNCNDFPGRTRVAVRNLIISDLNALTIFLFLFLLMPALPFNLKSYFPSLCLPTWYIYRLQS